MFRKEPYSNTIRFYFKRDTLFNDVSLMSNFMAKNLASKEGNSLTDDFSISDDEKDLFGVCVQQTLPDIYEAMAKITNGVSSAFEDAQTFVVPEHHSVPATDSFPSGAHAGSSVKGEYYDLPTYTEDGTLVYIDSAGILNPNPGTVREAYYPGAEYVTFILQDNAAYNENVLNLVDASLNNALKHGILKEFYSIVIQPEFFKVCTERFLAELFKLKQRLFQLKKKSVSSNLT